MPADYKTSVSVTTVDSVKQMQANTGQSFIRRSTTYHEQLSNNTGPNNTSNVNRGLATSKSFQTTDELIDNEQLIEKLFPKCRVKPSPNSSNTNIVATTKATKPNSDSLMKKYSKNGYSKKLTKNRYSGSSFTSSSIPTSDGSSSEEEIFSASVVQQKHHHHPPHSHHPQNHHHHSQQGAKSVSQRRPNVRKNCAIPTATTGPQPTPTTRRLWNFMDISASPSPPSMSPPQGIKSSRAGSNGLNNGVTEYSFEEEEEEIRLPPVGYSTIDEQQQQLQQQPHQQQQQQQSQQTQQQNKPSIRHGDARFRLDSLLMSSPGGSGTSGSGGSGVSGDRNSSKRDTNGARSNKFGEHFEPQLQPAAPQHPTMQQQQHHGCDEEDEVLFNRDENRSQQQQQQLPQQSLSHSEPPPQHQKRIELAGGKELYSQNRCSRTKRRLKHYAPSSLVAMPAVASPEHRQPSPPPPAPMPEQEICLPMSSVSSSVLPNLQEYSFRPSEILPELVANETIPEEPEIEGDGDVEANDENNSQSDFDEEELIRQRQRIAELLEECKNLAASRIIQTNPNEMKLDCLPEVPEVTEPDLVDEEKLLDRSNDNTCPTQEPEVNRSDDDDLDDGDDEEEEECVECQDERRAELGTIPIAEYEESPKRYGPKPGYPKRIPDADNCCGIEQDVNCRFSTSIKPSMSQVPESCCSPHSSVSSSVSSRSGSYSSSDLHSSSISSCHSAPMAPIDHWSSQGRPMKGSDSSSKRPIANNDELVKAILGVPPQRENPFSAHHLHQDTEPEVEEQDDEDGTSSSDLKPQYEVGLGQDTPTVGTSSLASETNEKTFKSSGYSSERSIVAAAPPLSASASGSQFPVEQRPKQLFRPEASPIAALSAQPDIQSDSGRRDSLRSLGARSTQQPSQQGPSSQVGAFARSSSSWSQQQSLESNESSYRSSNKFSGQSRTTAIAEQFSPESSFSENPREPLATTAQQINASASGDETVPELKPEEEENGTGNRRTMPVLEDGLSSGVPSSDEDYDDDDDDDCAAEDEDEDDGLMPPSAGDVERYVQEYRNRASPYFDAPHHAHLTSTQQQPRVRKQAVFGHPPPLSPTATQQLPQLPSSIHHAHAHHHLHSSLSPEPNTNSQQQQQQQTQQQHLSSRNKLPSNSAQPIGSLGTLQQQQQQQSQQATQQQQQQQPPHSFYSSPQNIQNSLASSQNQNHRHHSGRSPTSNTQAPTAGLHAHYPQQPPPPPQQQASPQAQSSPLQQQQQLDMTGSNGLPTVHDNECDTDQETDRLLGAQRISSTASANNNNNKNSADSYYDEEATTKRSSTSREVLIEGVLFRARYLGSTQLSCDGQPTKATRMMQAEEAVSRIKAPEGETQPSTEVDLFISTEKIMVLNTDLKEIMMDHALRTISYIADIGDLLVLMARRRNLDDTNDVKKLPKMICHVFESEEAQYIAQSIGQAFQVAYMEFLKANGIEDNSYLKEMDYQEVLNSQEIFGNELEMFAKRERQKEVIVPKQKGEMLGIVIVESGWGSMLPTVVIANLSQSSPAARCGQLNIGDQIIAINGISLVGLPLSTCQNYVKNTKNNTVVKFTMVPCAPVVEVKIKRPDTKYQLGFSVQNGVICSLLRGGIAERGGVRVGHRIIEINGQSVVAVPHDRIVNLLATSVGEIHMKTMPTSMFRLLTGQDAPSFM